MEDRQEFVLINRGTLIDMVKMAYRQASMVLLLEYIFSSRNVSYTLSAEEVCEVLNISWESLYEYRDKRWIKSTQVMQTQVYSAYDIALLSERINRRKILRKINKIPSVSKS